MWDKIEVNLGDVLEGSRHQINFKHLIPLTILEIKASCGCTKPVYNKTTGEINVTYKAGRVPKHLRYKGSFSTSKELTVLAVEGIYSLYIKVNVKMKYFYDR